MLLRYQCLVEYIECYRRYFASNTAAMSYLFILTLLRFKNLGHKTITYWDELFHAIVSRNLLKHFFVPTLYDHPYLPFNYADWTQNHIWLHKPILPLWEIAISYYIFGVNTFALRLPSAVLSSLSVLITYLIGIELYNKRIAFVAAFLQAFNPLMINLVHGYVFSDHIDISLIFWVELSCLMLAKGIKTGSVTYYILSGIAMGFGYLSKSYLCFVSLGIAVAIWCLAKVKFIKYITKNNINIKMIIFQFVGCILVVAPWIIYCFMRYPDEFMHENKMIITHLYDEVEIWRKPWDCHIFQYMPDHFPERYFVIAVSIIFLIISVVKFRKFNDTYIVLWIIGVMAPLSLGVSKVFAGTDIAIPALLICFASIFMRTIHGNFGVSAVCYFGVLVSMIPFSQWFNGRGDGFGESVLSGFVWFEVTERLVPSLYNNPGMLCELAFYLIVMLVFALIFTLSGIFPKSASQAVFKKLPSVMVWPLMICIAYPFIIKSIEITKESKITYDHHSNHKYSMDGIENIGFFIKETLPENTAVLLESSNGHDSLYLMFYADRSVYHVGGNAAVQLNAEKAAMTIRSLGGLSFLVSRNHYDFPLLFRSPVKPFYGIYVLM